ncbi:GntR family transcriptional regulator [Pseudoroseomonas cervicalis]|uniref:Transcriptional regulator, GntR family n=1 Tax=Pseudoroseomonas cervicalis ATCC 49957 TaxID=525371 RepID=D5RR07_9PROT|nr:GntR family transcriptional regulator [Pseudoroseomonas cervicalis]EFH10254.1 transcriptional regulator, GntR family [Pseudoroseomonas cervicalis ATCC 49957]
MRPLPPDDEPPLLQPIGRRPTAGELAFDSLRAAILSLSPPPGAVLSRAALAAQLGLSQTPVREALLRLQAEGLVEVVPSASTRVARIDLESAGQARFLRLALELELVQALARQPPAGLAASLQGWLARQEALLGDHAGFAAADDGFHAALYEAAGRAPLWALVRSRSGHLDRLRRLHLPAPGKAASILAEHRALVAAILAGDPAAAASRLRAHFAGTLGELAQIRQARPDYFQP